MPPKKSEPTEGRNKNLQPEKDEGDNSCKNPDLKPGTITEISKRNIHKDTLNLFSDIHKHLSTFQLRGTTLLNNNLKEALKYHGFGEKSRERHEMGRSKVMQQSIYI